MAGGRRSIPNSRSIAKCRAASRAYWLGRSDRGRASQAFGRSLSKVRPQEVQVTVSRGVWVMTHRSQKLLPLEPVADDRHRGLAPAPLYFLSNDDSGGPRHRPADF